MHIERLSFDDLLLIVNALPVLRPLILLNLLCFKKTVWANYTRTSAGCIVTGAPTTLAITILNPQLVCQGATILGVPGVHFEHRGAVEEGKETHASIGGRRGATWTLNEEPWFLRIGRGAMEVEACLLYTSQICWVCREGVHGQDGKTLNIAEYWRCGCGTAVGNCRNMCTCRVGGTTVPWGSKECVRRTASAVVGTQCANV